MIASPAGGRRILGLPTRSDIAQVFSGDKTVDNRLLNLAGAQALRAALARLHYKLRPASTDPVLAELGRKGVVVCEDFLSAWDFAALESEAEEFMAETGPSWVVRSGPTEVRRHLLAGADPGRFPVLSQWCRDERLVVWASAAERRSYPRRFDGGSLVERLTLGDSSAPDGDTHLHIDTFFDTHKIWLYLDDVTASNAAFVYVPGSHRMDLVRLRYEYMESTITNRKSRRVCDEEVRSRGLERQVFACRRNTLLLANTCGYHCRSTGEAGAYRRSLHKEFRCNPFRRERRRP